MSVVAVLAAACGPATEEFRMPRPAAPDKRSLYADAGLVPTREGEHIRREIAVAGEIMAAARTLPAVTEVHVDVELPREGVGEPRVLVAARLATDGTARGRTKNALANVVRGVVGELPEHAAVYVLSESEPPTQPTGGAPLVLVGACLLGLGTSAGMAMERARRRGRAPRPAPRADAPRF
jgi:hypothetical protein